MLEASAGGRCHTGAATVIRKAHSQQITDCGYPLIAKGGVFQPHSTTAFSHLGLVALSLLLAIGMSWAIVRRKLTGQVEVDTERG